MIRKVFVNIFVIMIFASTIYSMEPENICPQFQSDEAVKDFLHILGTTSKSSNQGNVFAYENKRWLISKNSYEMLNGSIPIENEQVISQESTADYITIHHLEFMKKEQYPSTRCFYKVLGTGRKAGQPITVNNEFVLTNLPHEASAKPAVGVASPSSAGEEKLVKQVKTTLGAEVHAFSNNKIVYQWDTLYQTQAYKEAKVGEEVTDNFIVPQPGNSQLLVRVQITKGNTEVESRKTQRTAANKIKSFNLKNARVAGVIYDENGKDSYYGGFWRDHTEYKDKKPDELITERFSIPKLCGIINGQNICTNNVSDVIIKKPDNNWLLPIPVNSINYAGVQQRLFVPIQVAKQPSATGSGNPVK